MHDVRDAMDSGGPRRLIEKVRDDELDPVASGGESGEVLGALSGQ